MLNHHRLTGVLAGSQPALGEVLIDTGGSLGYAVSVCGSTEPTRVGMSCQAQGSPAERSFLSGGPFF